MLSRAACLLNLKHRTLSTIVFLVRVIQAKWARIRANLIFLGLVFRNRCNIQRFAYFFTSCRVLFWLIGRFLFRTRFLLSLFFHKIVVPFGFIRCCLLLLLFFRLFLWWFRFFTWRDLLLFFIFTFGCRLYSSWRSSSCSLSSIIAFSVCIRFLFVAKAWWFLQLAFILIISSRAALLSFAFKAFLSGGALSELIWFIF